MSGRCMAVYGRYMHRRYVIEDRTLEQITR